MQQTKLALQLNILRCNTISDTIFYAQQLHNDNDTFIPNHRLKREKL